MNKTGLTFLILPLLLFPNNIDWGQCQEVQSKEKIVSAFGRKVPKEWGERVKGVKTRLNTDQKVLALTFDACGGLRGNGYDPKLIKYLENEKIPATLFISGSWIDANQSIFQELTKNPLFEIEITGQTTNLVRSMVVQFMG